MDYREFLSQKMQLGGNHGFDPLWLHDGMFDFQKALTEWALKKGRAAIFADCGLGKTIIQLVWADNVVRKTNGKVLILTPLAVAGQTVREAEKFGINAYVCRDGKIKDGPGIVVANYERLHYFSRGDYTGVVCDESSILKNFDGSTKSAITDFANFAKKLPYRLLCTATPSPNDYIELGTSSEALGYLGYIDMLKMFFKSDNNTYAQGGSSRGGAARYTVDRYQGKFRFRGHAFNDFWRWVCSWARACRKPSDMGFDDNGFVLPELITQVQYVKSRTLPEGWLFDVPAVGLKEQRAERRRTIEERCEKAAELVSDTNRPAICWCHLNDEGALLKSQIRDSVEIAGKDSDEKKEETFRAFQDGEIRVLITKPTIAGFGVNWQHCAHQTFFPSHSYEQYYQSIRRSWRFGQKNNVTIDIIATEGDKDVLNNMERKRVSADKMMDNLVELMNKELNIKTTEYGTTKEEIPTWLQNSK